MLIIIIVAALTRSPNEPVAEVPFEAPVVNQNTNQEITPPPVETPTPTINQVNVNEQSEQAQVLRLARIVIERYGSFSNRNNFENIRSLEPFMTDSFVQESLRYIDSNQDQGVDEEFYGVSTTAAALELTAFTESETAEVTVQTRRVETRSGAENTQFNQTAVMAFQNVEGNWKVNGITWQ